MAINHETETMTAYDKERRIHTFSIERDGRVFSVDIPDAELEACGPMAGAQAIVNKMKRRELVARRLMAEIRNG